jgi:hypothetical protein
LISSCFFSSLYSKTSIELFLLLTLFGEGEGDKFNSSEEDMLDKLDERRLSALRPTFLMIWLFFKSLSSFFFLPSSKAYSTRGSSESTVSI